ncbi:hypothetical protein Goarm_019311 [Gossypium armourianum]|uniref:Uncharacterized protein n=2 Tax=Gossypium TaxID=3633 RepID=A0A7J9BA49_GOSGO|nr:hypothetical protein [Gossypium gossypioides]MBA0822514.1 hypothetical protein [Gossypium armourianum]
MPVVPQLQLLRRRRSLMW